MSFGEYYMKELNMTVNPYDTFEDHAEIFETIAKNKSKIIDYVSQPDLWNTPIKKSNSERIPEMV